MAAAAITHSLPEDVVVDILARLPVKSLKRFRCVVLVVFFCGTLGLRNLKFSPCVPFEYPPSYKNCIEVAGLGYDSKRDEYKVIRIDTFWDGNFKYNDLSAPRGKRVALYNLTTDSWRKFNDNLNVDFFYVSTNNQVYSNGFYHCWAIVDNEDLLLSFDMSNEVFVATPFPDGGLGKSCRTTYYLTYLMEINGSLGGFLCHDYRVRNKCYDVWVLGELGLKNSWTKLFTIEPIPYVHIPLGVGSNGEIFFENEEGDFLAWHHPNNQEIKTLQFEGCAFALAMYAESLVSLHGGTTFNH
ncbi:F-box/kelch-repeat protein At3g06240-like [Durio zibethinus]|uniref:F-box/kelch-repeat protein At3g06240-like n=1 Tax=Durio zibethinus TaxID=66656 RepID=A0A6P5YP28_DURZI|nr:F-box/kelch-repeat protein At3g06240-like [Durio zibethinus]